MKRYKNPVPGIRMVLLALLVLAGVNALAAQTPVTRIMTQDASLNNLVEAADYKTGQLGSLGAVIRVGTGKQTMILIPGLGFGADVFKEFMESRSKDFTMYAVTLPGFGGTSAPPSPKETISFGEQTWTNASLAAIEKLIEDEKIQNPIIVGHWLTGTQIAVRLALKHPERTRAVILLAGSARFVPVDPKAAASVTTLAGRVAGIDRYMAPRWFKTVTRETWDDNNFLPGDYAIDPIMGLRLWRMAASPRLHVWVRYLCEFFAQDLAAEMGKLTVPTLMLRPGLDGIFHQPNANYMDAYLNQSWNGALDGNPRITAVTIPKTRVAMWLDEPEQVRRSMDNFLAAIR